MWHFNVSLDTYGVELKDGEGKAVLLSFMDYESGELHYFPIPLDTAKDLGQEIVRIATKLEEEES